MLKTIFIKYLLFCLSFLILSFLTGTHMPVQGQSWLSPDLHDRLTELRRENRFDEALNLLDQYLDSMDLRIDERQIFEIIITKADLYRMKGLNHESANLLDSLLKNKPGSFSGQDPLIGQLFTVQGTLFLTRGELKKGRQAIENAINIYSSRYGYADTVLGPCYNKMGNYFYFQKEYDSAMTWYLKALALADIKRNNQEDRASYIQNIGIIHLELNDYSRAEKCFLEALRLKESLYAPESFSLGRLYLNLGRFYQGISAMDKALIFISKAEKIYAIEKIPAALELGSIYWNKGLIYYLSGDPESAIIYLFNAKQIIDSVFSDNQDLIASLNSDIGNVYRHSGQYNKAIYYYNKTLMGADTQLIKKTYRNLAYLYHIEGDLNKAGSFYTLLMAASKTTLEDKNPENALTFLHYGYYLLETGNDSALFYLNKAFELFNENHGFHDREVAASLYIIGDYYVQKNQLMLALNYYQKSLISISSSFSDTNIFCNPSINSLRPDIRAINALSQKAECLNQCFAQNGEIKFLISSAQTYQLCLDLIDQLRMTLRAENSQLVLQNEFNKTYKQAVDICLTTFSMTKDKKWLYHAFEISERAKSMVLLNELKDANAKKIGLIPEMITKNEKEIKSNINLYRNNIWEEENLEIPDEKKLSYLRTNLLVFEKKYDSLKNLLELSYPDYFKLKYDPSVATVDKLQDILGKNEVIIEYTLSEDYVTIFLISQRQFEVKKVLIDKTLVQDIFLLRDNLDFRHVTEYDFQDFMEYQITAFKLYSKLIQPVASFLPGKKVIFIPDEELNYLSFESLIQNIIPSDTVSFRNLPYLIKSNPVSYAPSSTIFAMIKKGRIPLLDKGVLALAPSTSMLTRSMLANNAALAEQLKGDIDDLPGAAWEAENILKIMKGKKLIGEEATEAEFKKLAPSYDIIHFATHTRIDDENPLSSILSFYPYDVHGEDGKLHTYEIYNLDLKGELAVLSACSTGNGKLQKGEGVISLARAFTYAGMPSVIMTLWDVEDISTGNIVPFFYRLLLEGYDKDIALQYAKLKYLKQTKPEIETHPAFWSGFVLYGNNRGFRHKSLEIYTILLLVLGGFIILVTFVIVRKYINFRQNQRRNAINLPSKFRPEDRV